MTPAREVSPEFSIDVRVPASTANLGAGFDCLGLALELYLNVRATVLSKPGARVVVRSRGVLGSSALPSAPEENLISRAMRHTADRQGFHLPPVRLAVQNDIPMASGLGSSAAATVAGVVLGFSVAGRAVPKEAALQYAGEVEGHTDNVAASLLGGLVVTFTRDDGSIIGVQKRWPKMIRVVAVTPLLELATKKSRAVLPKMVERADAVHNLQRSALLVAALEERRYDLIWDALHDRLHQTYRQTLIPGLGEILAMPKMPGLLGIALSGAGPSVIALATDRFDAIGKEIASRFERHGLTATFQMLEIAQEGFSTSEKHLRRR
ncbi:MAG TPA: homoserine kinase [Candidatus Acidoferrales bacterium]|nr:homoserine kinase [Candidatus Acidoferrales bacterium]